MLIGDNLASTIISYVLNGLNPGSCGTAILLGDRNLANKTAHPNIKLNQNSIIDDTIAWVHRVLPAFILNDKENIRQWIEHDGMKGAPLDRLMAVKLATPRLFDDWYNMHDGRAIMQKQK